MATTRKRLAVLLTSEQMEALSNVVHQRGYESMSQLAAEILIEACGLPGMPPQRGKYSRSAKLYTFENHHNGATRSKSVGEIPNREPDEITGYVSDDSFRPQEFGNGWTQVKIWHDEKPTNEHTNIADRIVSANGGKLTIENE